MFITTHNVLCTPLIPKWSNLPPRPCGLYPPCLLCRCMLSACRPLWGDRSALALCAAVLLPCSPIYRTIFVVPPCLPSAAGSNSSVCLLLVQVDGGMAPPALSFFSRTRLWGGSPCCCPSGLATSVEWRHPARDGECWWRHDALYYAITLCEKQAQNFKILSINSFL